MADVRALLQNERASRRITHPDLSYTKSGLLNCTVCDLLIKSESLWERHLRSPIHKKSLQARSNVGVTAAGGPVSKKRKIDDEDDDTRKKSKAEEGNTIDSHRRKEVRFEDPPSQPPEVEPLPEQEDDAEDNSETAETVAQEENPSATNGISEMEEPYQPAIMDHSVAIDEDEWTAFEREVVPLTHDRPAAAAASTEYASATISAAPVSAAEIAAEEAARQMPQREKEAEDEKEEEDRRMEEEFEIMAEMEEKVRRLKEKREALRKNLPLTSLAAAATIGSVIDNAEDDGDKEALNHTPDADHDSSTGKKEDDDIDDNDDESSEYDDWGFA